MAPRAGQIFISMMSVFLVLGTIFGIVYTVNLYPIIAAIGGTIALICLFTWIVWSLLYAPPDPDDY